MDALLVGLAVLLMLLSLALVRMCERL